MASVMTVTLVMLSFNSIVPPTYAVNLGTNLLERRQWVIQSSFEVRNLRNKDVVVDAISDAATDDTDGEGQCGNGGD